MRATRTLHAVVWAEVLAISQRSHVRINSIYLRTLAAGWPCRFSCSEYTGGTISLTIYGYDGHTY